MRRITLILGSVFAVALIVFAAVQTTDAQGPLPRPQLWAGCEYFESVVAPTAFDPAHGNYDELYKNPNGYKDGLPLISEVKPGDPGFNGGRWHVNLLKAGVSADKYADACSVDDLDLNDFESTNDYFECPVLPRRGNRP